MKEYTWSGARERERRCREARTPKSDFEEDERDENDGEKRRRRKKDDAHVSGTVLFGESIFGLVLESSFILKRYFASKTYLKTDDSVRGTRAEREKTLFDRRFRRFRRRARYINKLALVKKARVHVAMKMHPRRTVATHIQNSVWDLEKRPAFSFNRRLTLSKILSHTGAKAMEEEIRNSLVA